MSHCCIICREGRGYFPGHYICAEGLQNLALRAGSGTEAQPVLVFTELRFGWGAGGSIAVSVAFDDFVDETIDLLGDTGGIIQPGQWLYITIEGDYDNYAWYWDGSVIGWDNTLDYYVSFNALPGIYSITAVVSRGNEYFSKELIFQVTR